MASLCFGCGEYIGQNDRDTSYCKCVHDELESLKKQVKELTHG